MRTRALKLRTKEFAKDVIDLTAKGDA